MDKDEIKAALREWVEECFSEDNPNTGGIAGAFTERFGNIPARLMSEALQELQLEKEKAARDSFEAAGLTQRLQALFAKSGAKPEDRISDIIRNAPAAQQIEMHDIIERLTVLGEWAPNPDNDPAA